MWETEGLRIVELGGGISAPFACRLLADFGAEVIKAEPPEGDRSRRTGISRGSEATVARSDMFLYLNAGKRGVTLDLTTGEGLERLSQMLDGADAVVENLGVGEFDRLRRRLRIPDSLVICSISPYGQDGPKAGLLGSELSAYASSGMMYMTGLADRPPVKQGLHQAEHLAGVNAAAATLAATRLARRQGVGQRIDISLQETVALAGFPALNVYTHTGAVVKRAPASLAQLMTSQAMRASDGWVMPSDAGIDVWWESFAGFLERPELLDPPFETSAGRREHSVELDRITAAAFSERTMDDLFHSGQSFGLTMSSIQTAAEISACPHLAAREFWVEQDDPIAGQVRLPGPVPRTSQRRPERRPAPLLGEHNAEVFDAPPDSSPTTERHSTGGGAPSAPLEGVRILELGMVFVLPLAITPLAALGADVIKVEAASRPDSVRWGPQPGNELHAQYYNVGGNFHHLNRNKRGVAIDLRTERGRELLLELVAKSDVVAENFTPRVLANLGLGYEDLRAVNPAIILLSSSGFGQTGPWRHYKAYGPITEALDGLMHLTGHPEQPPLRGGAGGWGVAFTDVAGAYFGTYSILAALEHRDRTGEGMWLDLSHYEAGVATVPEAILEYEATGFVATRNGNRDPERCPQGAYPTSAPDSWIAISIESDHQFEQLCRVLSIDSTAFPDPPTRRAREDELDQLISEATRGWDTAVLAETLQGARVEATAVASPRDVWFDPQLRHRGWPELTPAPRYAPDIGARPFPRAAWRTTVSRSAPRPAPAFGENTREVLEELLAFDDAVIDELYEAGVLAEAPRTGLVNPRPLPLADALRDGRLSTIDPDYRTAFD